MLTHVRIVCPVHTNWPGYRWPSTWRVEIHWSHSQCGNGIALLSPSQMFPVLAKPSCERDQSAAASGNRLRNRNALVWILLERLLCKEWNYYALMIAFTYCSACRLARHPPSCHRPGINGSGDPQHDSHADRHRRRVRQSDDQLR